MELSLKGKNALVCGGSKGIGFAIAQELALLGARVTLLARSSEALQLACEKLNKISPGAHDFFVADAAQHEPLTKVLDTMLSKHTRFDILINNTGGPPPGTVANAKPEEFIAALNQHLIANHLVVGKLLPGMKQAGFGRIINIISTSVREPIVNLGVSNTTRAAVASWAKTLSREVASFGITVNNVLPGATHTDRIEAILEKNAAQKGMSKEAVQKEMESEIPLGRFAEPREIAQVAAFLATPAASYVSGVSLPVDGGRQRSI